MTAPIEPASADRVMWLSDRIELRDLVERYSRALDERDADALARCFSPDASVLSTRGTVLERGEFVTGTLAALARWPVVQHLVTGQIVSFADGRVRASGDVYAVAMQGDRQTQSREELVAGLRYLDKYVRSDDEWLIQRRELRVMWSRGDWPWPVLRNEELPLAPDWT